MKPTDKESYEPGIESYEGAIPLWLILLAFCLAAWGVFYLTTYWNGPPSGP